MTSVKTVRPAKVIGEGPIHVIALHGWMGDHRLFEPSFPYWDRQKLTVAFLDCRGYGTRLEVTGEYTVEEVALDIRELAKSLGWARYHVIGHSMTGMTAQRLTVDAPSEIQSIILAAALPASGAKINDERRQLLQDAIKDEDVRKNLIDVNTGQTMAPEWLDDLRDLSLAGTSPEPLYSYMASWTGTDFSSDVVGNKTPVLAIIGGKDPGGSVDRTKETVGKWFESVAVEVLADAGHYPMYEAPQQFVEIVSNHLAQF